MKRWIVKRTLIETYEVHAETRQEALDNAQDPSSVVVKSASARLSEDPPCCSKPTKCGKRYKVWLGVKYSGTRHCTKRKGHKGFHWQTKL